MLQCYLAGEYAYVQGVCVLLTATKVIHDSGEPEQVHWGKMNAQGNGKNQYMIDVGNVPYAQRYVCTMTMVTRGCFINMLALLPYWAKG